MKYISQLDRDSKMWKVLGVGQLVLSEVGGDFDVIFHCRSFSSLPKMGRSRGVGRSVRLPLAALRTLTPGTLWQYGKKICGRTYGGHWVSLSGYEISYVDAIHHLHPEDVDRRLSQAACPMSEFLKHVNYVKFENSNASIIIPCAELFRYFLCPTNAYAKLVLTPDFQSWLPRQLDQEQFSMPRGRVRFSEKELHVTEAISSSVNSLECAVLPFKRLQVTFLNNILLGMRKNLLLKALLSIESHSSLRVSGSSIVSPGCNNRQIHSLVVDKIYDSDCGALTQYSTVDGGLATQHDN